MTASWPSPRRPAQLDAILTDTHDLGFTMACEPEVGGLLATLAAGKPGARVLEIGTGTGVGTAWLLSGLDAAGHLISLDQDERVQAVAHRHLGRDARLTIVTMDGGAWLEANSTERFDLIFADSWPGKFTHLDLALGLLARGGFYVVDDLKPQPTWPRGHGAAVEAFVATLSQRPDLIVSFLPWASGVAIAARR